MALPNFRFDDPPFVVDAPLPATRAIDAERDRMARLTARGIGMPIAGLLYWLVVAAFVRELPMRSALFWSFCATGVVFPAGLLITRWFGGDLFAKSERFTSLGLLFNAMQLMFWPVILVVWRVAPEWVPFVMATLFGSHFLGYAWLYRSRGYAVLAAGPFLVLTAAVLVARDPLYTIVPLIAAAIYAVAVGFLYTEVRRVG